MCVFSYSSLPFLQLIHKPGYLTEESVGQHWISELLDESPSSINNCFFKPGRSSQY